MHMGFILGSNAFQTCIWIIIPLWDSCNNFQFLDETWFLSYAKDQLFSKALVVILNFSKNEQQKFDLRTMILQGNYLSYFLEELKTPKSSSEIKVQVF